MDNSKEQSVSPPQYKCSCGLLEYYPEKCCCGMLEHYWDIEIKPKIQTRFHEYDCKPNHSCSCSCGFLEDMIKDPDTPYSAKESSTGTPPSLESFEKLLVNLKEACSRIDMSYFDTEE